MGTKQISVTFCDVPGCPNENRVVIGLPLSKEPTLSYIEVGEFCGHVCNQHMGQLMTVLKGTPDGQ